MLKKAFVIAAALATAGWLFYTTQYASHGGVHTATKSHKPVAVKAPIMDYANPRDHLVQIIHGTLGKHHKWVLAVDLSHSHPAYKKALLADTVEVNVYNELLETADGIQFNASGAKYIFNCKSGQMMAKDEFLMYNNVLVKIIYKGRPELGVWEKVPDGSPQARIWWYMCMGTHQQLK